MPRHARLFPALALLCAPLGVACSGVLGIEERTYEAPAAGPVCETYCAEVKADCEGDFQLYASDEACMATCARLPEGTAGEQTGNTINCRIAQAKLAKSTGELGDYCKRAGPGGDDVCGSNCEGFCAIMVPVCGPDFYESTAECMAACAPVPDNHDYSSNVPYEDSVQCRLYHVTSATLSLEHCAHAAGEMKCVDETGGGGGGG